MSDDDFTAENFTANLKLAASYYPSISEMCRKLEINRQQFTRYLSGASFPSRHTLRRMCDFLGIDEYEILMPHDQFRNIVRLRPARDVEDVNLPPHLGGLVSDAQRHHGALTKAHGYYHQYYLSFSTPKHVLQSLVYIYGWRDFTLYKRIERLRHPDQVGPPEVYKYAGMITIIGDRMHLIDHETITGSELTQTVLYLNYRNRISMLSGLTLGVSGGDAHQPSASRAVLEYLGRSVNLRQALSECKLHSEEAPKIRRRIVEHLTAGGRVSGPLRGAVF